MSFSSDDPYAGHDPDSWNHWYPLEHDQLAESPFSIYFMKLQSGSDELDAFIREPRSALRGDVENLGALPGVTEDSVITTTIAHHDRGLNLSAMYAVAVVDSQDDSVAVTTFKHRPPA